MSPSDRKEVKMTYSPDMEVARFRELERPLRAIARTAERGPGLGSRC